MSEMSCEDNKDNQDVCMKYMLYHFDVADSSVDYVRIVYTTILDAII